MNLTQNFYSKKGGMQNTLKCLAEKMKQNMIQFNRKHKPEEQKTTTKKENHHASKT